MQRDSDRTEPSPISGEAQAPARAPAPRVGVGVRSLPPGETATAACEAETVGEARGVRAALRKTMSVDDRLMQPATREQQRQHRLLSKMKLRNIHVSTGICIHLNVWWCE